MHCTFGARHTPLRKSLLYLRKGYRLIYHFLDPGQADHLRELGVGIAPRSGVPDKLHVLFEIGILGIDLGFQSVCVPHIVEPAKIVCIVAGVLRHRRDQLLIGFDFIFFRKSAEQLLGFIVHRKALGDLHEGELGQSVLELLGLRFKTVGQREDNQRPALMLFDQIIDLV